MSTKDTIIRDRFNGDEEAYREWMRSLGSKGGKLSKSPPNHPGRFDNNRELAARAGRLGGKSKKRLADTNVKRIIERDK